jgi:hypothetical protein
MAGVSTGGSMVTLVEAVDADVIADSWVVCGFETGSERLGVGGKGRAEGSTGAVFLAENSTFVTVSLAKALCDVLAKVTCF